MLLRPNTIYKWDLHYEQAVRKTASFFRFRNNLGEMGFYRETMDFWVFAIGLATGMEWDKNLWRSFLSTYS